jgi:hypothetical protein
MSKDGMNIPAILTAGQGEIPSASSGRVPLNGLKKWREPSGSGRPVSAGGAEASDEPRAGAYDRCPARRRTWGTGKTQRNTGRDDRPIPQPWEAAGIG